MFPVAMRVVAIIVFVFFFVQVQGIKGYSLALSLCHQDIVKGTCLDYMHGLLLGVVKTLGLPSPEGHSREIYDYQRTAQIKRHVKERKLTLEDSDSIAEFSKTFAVQELHVRKYLEHPQYLEVEKSKQKDDRKHQRETDSQKKYADYNWEEMFMAGTLKKPKVSALNLFLEKHQLGNKKMKKNERPVLISACLTKAQLDKATIEQAARKVNMEQNVDFHDGEHEEETGDDDDDYNNVHADDTDGDDNNDCGDKEYDGGSKNYDVVLQEIGSSIEEEEDDDDDEQEVIDGRR